MRRLLVPLAVISAALAVVGCGEKEESLKPGAVSNEVRALFEAVDASRGDSLIAFGWAMAEDLAALA